MDEKTRQRQNASRAARVARGERQVSVWLQPIAVEALALLSEGADATHAINAALVQQAAEFRREHDLRALGAARAGVVMQAPYLTDEQRAELVEAIKREPIIACAEGLLRVDEDGKFV